MVHVLTVLGVSWLAVSLALALVCGRALRRADRRPQALRTEPAPVRSVA